MRTTRSTVRTGLNEEEIEKEELLSIVKPSTVLPPLSHFLPLLFNLFFPTCFLFILSLSLCVCACCVCMFLFFLALNLFFYFIFLYLTYLFQTHISSSNRDTSLPNKRKSSLHQTGEKSKSV